MNTIDVDVGGTFTDLVLTLDGETRYRKVPTTPYDLSVGFMQVVEEAAEEAGLPLDELVQKVETVRYSTTVAMNRLLERSGPRVALITTQGHEDATLIGKGAQWIDGTRLDERRALPLQDKPKPIVPRELIAGVKERIDARGEVIRPLNEEHVREQVRRLVDRGARAFVVITAVVVREPAAREGGQADHPRGVPRLPRRLPAGDPVLRGRLAAGRVRAHATRRSLMPTCSARCRSSSPARGTSCASAATAGRSS